MADIKAIELTEASVAVDRELESPKPSESEARENRNILERYITPTAIVNFGFILQSSWEGAALSFQFALLNGGPASLLYGSLIAGSGSLALALSLAEMASMDPVVGAQYRWTAAFALSHPEFWSLIQGWLTVFAWIATTASTPAFLANIVTGLVIFNFPDYEPERWHGTLIMWGFVVITVVPNFWFRQLIILELLGGICHVLCFITTVISLAVLAKHSTAGFVFKTLTHDAPGWTNPAAAFSIGLLTVTFPLSGFDGVLHMSDEVKEPRIRVPRSMILSVAMNWAMQFAFVVTLLFCIGDIDKVANSPTGMPMIEVYNEALQSKSGTTFLLVVIAVIAVIAMFNMIASVSRLVWAFSKDNGLPFSATFSRVDQKLHVPVNSLLLVGVICCLLAIINVGSSTAFNALLSLPTIGLYLSYLVPISLLLVRKVRGMHPRYGPFRLGRWGIPVNTFACAYAAYILVWVAFPVMLPVTKLNMNYASPVMVGVILLALGDWVVSGRKRFRVPVTPQHKHGD